VTDTPNPSCSKNRKLKEKEKKSKIKMKMKNKIKSTVNDLDNLLLSPMINAVTTPLYVTDTTV